MTLKLAAPKKWLKVRGEALPKFFEIEAKNEIYIAYSL